MYRGGDFELQLIRMVGLAPMLLTMLAGMILAIRRIPSEPRTSWALIAALAVSSFNLLGLPVLLQAAMQLAGGIQSTDDLRLRTLLFTLPHSLVGAVAWGLILFAVFAHAPPPKFLREDDPDRDLLDAP
jgi:hypothetical protein